MSDEDRLDRAERIRRMREGRGGGNDDGDGPSDDAGDEANENSPEDGDDGAESDDDANHGAESDDDANHGDTPNENRDGEDEPEPSTGEERAPAAEDAAGSETTLPDSELRQTESDNGAADTADISGDSPSGLTDPDEQVSEAGSDESVHGGGPTAVTQEMTAAEIARMVDQESDDTKTEDGTAVDRRGEEGTLRAGSVSGDTIVDASFFEEGGRAQIIEFSLGEELFAIDVGFVGEIIETPEITRIPNTPDCIQGVVDLRGKVTAVMDPSPVLASEAELTEESLIVVLDADAIEYDGTVGWLVDDVRQVTTIASTQVTDPPEEDEWVRGIVDREDETFVIWADPEAVLDEVDTTGISDVTAEPTVDAE